MKIKTTIRGGLAISSGSYGGRGCGGGGGYLYLAKVTVA
jgi:hypothetical protein